MTTLRDLYKLTSHAHTKIYVCDRNAKEYIELKEQMANDYPGETEVAELDTVDDCLRAWVLVSPATIKHWKTKYGC